MANKTYNPYLHKCRQPCIRHVVNVVQIPPNDIVTIDSWLVEHLKIERDKLYEAPRPNEDPRSGLVRNFLRRVFALYTDILNGGEVPSFEPGRTLKIEALEKPTGAYRCAIALPVLDNLPLSIFTNLFEQCLKVVRTIFTTVPTTDAVTTVFSELDDNVIGKLKASLPLWGDGLPFYKVAYDVNVPFRHIGGGIMLLGWGAKGQLSRGTLTMGDSHLGGRICMNKWQAARVLRDAGLPGAENRPVYSKKAAIDAALDLGWPVVVKPSDQAQSVGVHVNITNESDLLVSYENARQVSEHVLIERHVPGLCHRIMVAGGRVVYAVSRLPKSVLGNGRDTISELIGEANRIRMASPPWKRLKQFPDDDETERTVQNQGLTMQAVPLDGQIVFLRAITSGQLGGSVENLTEKIHPANAQLAIDIARQFGLRIAGIDFISNDITVPWYDNGAIINEINFNPQFMSREREKEARTLFEALMEDNGRIPVYVVTGEGDILGKSIELKNDLANKGQYCHLTTSEYTEDSQGNTVPMSFDTLFERSMALILRNDVTGIILVSELEDIIRSGLPVDIVECSYILEKSRGYSRQILRHLRNAINVRSYRLLEA